MQEERVFVERRSGAWKKYIGIGLTAFFVLAAIVVVVFIFVRNEKVSQVMGSIGKALQPAVVGAVLAYLMNPLLNFFEGKLKRLFFKRARNFTRARKAARAIGIFITLVFVLAIIGILAYLIIPELTATVSQLVDEMPAYGVSLQEWLTGLTFENETIQEAVTVGVTKVSEYVEDLISNRLFETLGGVLGSVFTGIWNVFSVVYNLVIGLVFSVYMLAAKETLGAQSKKIIYSMFKRRRANTILRITRACHLKFTNSFTGKIVDSAVVGVICFVAMTIMDLPYALLVSVIIGVTNVIPFFGPWIGAIPSALLIFVVDPMECLYFIIMIIILQQLDCNVLTPKIVGDTVGLSAFWVLFSCIFFGSLWGVVGMLVGTPVMASIYMIVKEIVEEKLHKRGLMTETADYAGLEAVDETEVYTRVVEVDEEGRILNPAEGSTDPGRLYSVEKEIKAVYFEDTDKPCITENEDTDGLNPQGRGQALTDAAKEGEAEAGGGKPVGKLAQKLKSGAHAIAGKFKKSDKKDGSPEDDDENADGADGSKNAKNSGTDDGQGSADDPGKKQ